MKRVTIAELQEKITSMEEMRVKLANENSALRSIQDRYNKLVAHIERVNHGLSILRAMSKAMLVGVHGWYGYDQGFENQDERKAALAEGNRKLAQSASLRAIVAMEAEINNVPVRDAKEITDERATWSKWS